jgi:hypothetical protein
MAKLTKAAKKIGKGETVSWPLRAVPKELHRAWKACAALEGVKMSEFIEQALWERVRKVRKKYENQGSNEPSTSPEAPREERETEEES